MTRFIKRVVADEAGAAYAAIEMVLVLGLILLPLLAGIAQIPRWVDAKSAVDMAAQEAARTMVLADSWAAGRDAAEVVVAMVLENRGVDVGAVETVEVRGDLVRGGAIAVTVTVRVPPVVLPGFGPVGGSISLSRSATERVDDYRQIQG